MKNARRAKPDTTVRRVLVPLAIVAVLAGALLLIDGTTTTRSADAAIPNTNYCATRAETDQIRVGWTAQRVRRHLDGQHPFTIGNIIGGTTGRKLWAQEYWGCGYKNAVIGFTRTLPHRVVRKANGTVGVLWVS